MGESIGRAVRASCGEWSDESIGAHTHSAHQLLVVMRGLMLFEDEQYRHVLCGQNAAFIPGNCLHTAEVVGETVPFFSLYFEQAGFDEHSDEPSLSLPRQIVVFPISPLFSSLFRRLCVAAEEPLTSETKRAALRLLFLLFLEENQKRMPIVLPCSTHEELKPILRYIQTNAHRPLGMEDLERRFHQSRRTIQRLFRREINATFSEYLRMCRIFQATVLLSTTTQPILEIALQVGYESLSSFYHAFRALLGITPKKYRKELVLR